MRAEQTPDELSDYWRTPALGLIAAWWPKLGRSRITQRNFRAGTTNSLWAMATAVVILPMLLAPALWNGYPLLQSDTGGYLARWYEGYLVPSRSTVFGLYLHIGEEIGRAHV